MDDQSLSRQGLPFLASIVIGSLVFVGGLAAGGANILLGLALVVLGVGLLVFGLVKFFVGVGGKEA